MNDEERLFQEAQAEYQMLRYRAIIETAVGTVRGKSASLCNFEGLKAGMNLHTQVYRGIQDVPLKSIIGSSGRSGDFTRTFLPRRPELRDRWAGVYAKVTGLSGLPPVKLYRVCNSYFVADGNHRVSVAYRLNAKTIQAEVIEFSSEVCVPVGCM